MRTLLTGALLAGTLAGLGLGARAEDEGRAAQARAKAQVARVWHGKTPRAKADEYERYLAEAVKKFPTIPGNLGYQVMRLDGGPDGEQYTEFQVISYWESLEAIEAYAGEDIRRTRHLPRDPEFLVGLEPYVRNYALRVEVRVP